MARRGDRRSQATPPARPFLKDVWALNQTRETMSHHTPLIATMAMGLVLAFVLGMIANRFRLSPILGYLLAGVIIGPFTPGPLADVKLAAELAEIGVILLMFGVGLHFSYRDLFAVKNIAIPGALAQIAAATALGMGLAAALGWSLAGGLIFGLALSVASTVVLLRALEARQLLDTRSGHIAVGWLIVEDLAMVFALVVLPALAGVLPGAHADAQAASAPEAIRELGGAIAKLLIFVALMFVFGRRFVPWMLSRVAGTGSRELFTLCILAIGIGIAYGAAALFDVSFALGAFFAGMILKESELSHKAAEDTLPLRDAFAVLFFVSVGMLFNPAVLIEEPLAVLATAAIIIIGKSVAAYAIVRAFRFESRTALVIAVSLAQVGEFSFILVTLGLQLGALPPEGRDLVLAGAIISIMANPALFGLVMKIREKRTPAGAGPAAAPPPILGPDWPQGSLGAEVIVIGLGRVGKRLHEGLQAMRTGHVVVETDLGRVGQLREMGAFAVHGNAAREEVLKAAGVEEATHILIATPNGIENGEIAARARKLNPGVRIIARAHIEAELDHLVSRGADYVVMDETEIARAMIGQITPRAVQP